MTDDNDRSNEAQPVQNQRSGLPFTRRGILAAGAMGLGLAGSAAAQQAGGNASNSRFAVKEHDHSGEYGAATYLGEHAPVERIDVARIGGSRREGDVVFYDPDDRGPYTDGQDALDDVPTGGTLQIGHGVWDVATEGRIALSRPVLIRGTGWSKEPGTFGAEKEYHGTRIVNTGSDSVDAPSIEFASSERQNKATVRDLAVEHHGNSPAILIDNFIRTLVADCLVWCGDEAPVGIKYENSAFFARAVRNSVMNFTDCGIRVTGGGYAHEFYSNHVATPVAGATALETQRNRTIIMGGEYAVTGEGGTGIKFHNPGGAKRNGGYVVEPGIELTETGIDIAGEGERFDNVQIFHATIGSLHRDSVDVGVKFGKTAQSKYVYPVVQSSGKLVEWSENAYHCGVISDVGNLAGCTYADNGAYNPYVQIVGTAPKAMLPYLPTGVPTKVEYCVDENSAVFHDGESWYTQASATKSFNPGGNNDEPDTVHYDIANKTITPDGSLETAGLSAWNVDADGTVIEIVDGDAAGTIGGEVRLSWDADNLYFQAAIDDQTHAQPYDVGQLFHGDNVQFAVAPGSGGWEEFQQYTLALTGDGTVVYGQIKSSSETRNASVRSFDAAIVRDDASEVTSYEVAVPWSELDALGGFDPSNDEYVGVDWAILDNDGDQRDGIENYARWDVTGDSAITGGKQPDHLKTAQLLD